ncbi:hypothetical protein VX037_18745 [Gordonia sp. Z-3]|uniref:hypothetical protein n=1 Tax=Gordonia sp. Z-3 TaxID=3115408 RepID=UPI002E2BC507|nr:hypothetical protein [Gordonia sp. Z-3]MED5803066.1 hypothetical protein [Gordonia sp. Z-3]
MSTEGGIAILAVGIDFPPSEDVSMTKGLARRALRFAQIARNHSVPKDSIILMIQGTEEEITEADSLGRVFAATGEGFTRNAVPALRAKAIACDLAVLYWAGHGTMGRNDSRLLLFGGSTTPVSCISEEELMSFVLGKDESGQLSPFNRVMLIADACANPSPSVSKSQVEAYQFFDPKWNRSSIYATQLGMRAHQNSGFSELIMDWLESRATFDWWELRLSDVRDLYDELGRRGYGQQPAAVYADVRGEKENLSPNAIRPFEVDDLPSELFSAYHIDTAPRTSDQLTIPVCERSIVRLDVTFFARRSPFRAIVVNSSHGPSFPHGLQRTASYLGALAESSNISAQVRWWRVEDADALTHRNAGDDDSELTSKARSSRPALPDRASKPSALNGLLFSVQIGDLGADWGSVWAQLQTMFPEDAIVIILSADTTLSAVHHALIAAHAGIQRHIDVEVYCRPAPSASAGLLSEWRETTDILAALKSEIAIRRRALLGAQAGPTEAAVFPTQVPPRLAVELVESLNTGKTNLHEEASFLRRIRENLPELWPAINHAYAALRFAPGWAEALTVAADVQADLASFLRSAVNRDDEILEDFDVMSGWLTQSIVDQVGLEVYRFRSDRAEDQSITALFDRAWQVWRPRMTAAAREAMEDPDSTGWNSLTGSQIALLVRHGFSPPVDGCTEIVRWVKVANSSAGVELLKLMELEAGAFASAVFDRQAAHIADPEREKRLAGLRHAVRPKHGRNV